MLTEKLKCTGCGACKAICPQNAIEMKADKYGFVMPSIDIKKCNKCNLCEKKCPVNKESVASPELCFWGYKNKNEKIRLESSSGGLFSLLADLIIENEGVVAGSALDKDCRNCGHIIVSNVEKLKLLRGSKYFQSDIRDSFIQIKSELRRGKLVLFCGTPCQVAGLKSFLGKEYVKLITIDFICHGVASPYVWRKYVDYEENQENSKLSVVSFRNKNLGWLGFSMKLNFKNGINKVIPISKSLFMRGYLENLFLRDSCYRCRFKDNNYYSDITIADFWGIEDVFPQIDDNKGISLCIAHSKKGLMLLEKINSEADIIVSNKENALKKNRAYYQTTKYNFWRGRALKEFAFLEFDKVIEKYCGLSLTAKIRRKISQYYKRKL